MAQKREVLKPEQLQDQIKVLIEVVANLQEVQQVQKQKLLKAELLQNRVQLLIEEVVSHQEIQIRL